MHRKLWPKVPAKESALGRMSKNFQVYFIHINFLRNETNKIDNRVKNLYYDTTIFVYRFFIVYL